MVNQQKGVQQETAYSAVVVNDHMYAFLVRPGALALSFATTKRKISGTNIKNFS